MAAPKKNPSRKKYVKKSVKKKSPVRTKSVKKSVKKKLPRTKKATTKKAPTKKKPGRKRQVYWTVNGKRLNKPQIIDDFCLKISHTSAGIKRICSANPGYPSHETIRKWLLEDSEFVGRYARAREEQCETMADEIIEIADDARFDVLIDKQGNEKTDNEVLQRSKLRIDTRKFLMGKIKPKKFGDKLDLNVTERRIEMTPEQFAAWKENFG